MKKSSSLSTAAILSLSFLTVMAGAATAPALDIIEEHFQDTSSVLVQMIVSLPALFIILVSFVFPVLCKRFDTRNLTLWALLLYLVSGCIPYVLDNIWVILVFRALLGMSVGVLMPLSTGLLVKQSAPEKHAKLLGVASAFNYLGAVLATVITGVLSRIGWNLSFLVYLMAVVPLVACILYLPSDRMTTGGSNPFTRVNLKRYIIYMGAMYLAMGTFFIYPTNFAISVASNGYLVPAPYITIVMAGMDLIAMLMGLFYERIIKVMKGYLRYLAPVSFIIGYVMLFLSPQPLWVIVGSLFVGIGSGIGIPYVFASSSHKFGPESSATLMPLLSASMFFAQFTIPFIVSAGGSIGPYAVALILSATMLIFNHWKGRK